MRYSIHFLSKYVTSLGAGDSNLLLWTFSTNRISTSKGLLVGIPSSNKAALCVMELVTGVGDGQNEQMGTGVRIH